mgnify:CR=1 FL=1
MGGSILQSFHVRPASKLSSTLLILFGPPKAMPRNVCSSSGRIERRYLDLAADVGAELARRGHSLVSGGATVSCMGGSIWPGPAAEVGMLPGAT